MKINQIIINELSESAQPGVATTTAQTPQAQAAAQAIQKGLEKLQQQSPGLDHSFNTTTAIQEILPDGTVVMDSNLQPSALQNVRKILALGGGANFKVSMSYQGIPSAANMSTVPPAQPGVAEGTEVKTTYHKAYLNHGGGGRFPNKAASDKAYDQVLKTHGSKALSQLQKLHGTYTDAAHKAGSVYKGVAEGDSQEPTGRVKSDGTRSHSTYGSRDHYSDSDPQATGTPTTAKKTTKQATDILNKAFKDVDKKKGVAEAGNANSGRRGPNFQDNSPAIPGRVEPLPQGLKHHADASRYGGTEPNVEDDRLLGPASRHRLHQAVTPDDWFDESQEKIAGRHDPDDFDNMVGRLKQLAGAGPLKTVWDPEKRVYRNVPHAVQPPQQPKKATQ